MTHHLDCGGTECFEGSTRLNKMSLGEAQSKIPPNLFLTGTAALSTPNRGSDQPCLDKERKDHSPDALVIMERVEKMCFTEEWSALQWIRVSAP